MRKMHEDLWALGRTNYLEPRDLGYGIIIRAFPTCNGSLLIKDTWIKNIISEASRS